MRHMKKKKIDSCFGRTHRFEKNSSNCCQELEVATQKLKDTCGIGVSETVIALLELIKHLL